MNNSIDATLQEIATLAAQAQALPAGDARIVVLVEMSDAAERALAIALSQLDETVRG